MYSSLLVYNELPEYGRPWNVEQTAGGGGRARRSPLKGILAGGITGGVEVGLSFPAEYVKTQLQLGGNMYNGIRDCVRQTVRTHGLGGLYQGLGVLLLGAVPKSAVRFGAYEAARGYGTSRVLCGLAAGVAEGLLVVTPLEAAKVKIIHDCRSARPRYRGLLHGLATILKEDGLSALYQGGVATVLRQASNQAIRFFVMGTLKQEYRGGDETVRIPKHIIGIFGIIAGAASVFANNPIDVVKTRMQCIGPSKFNSIRDCIKHIWMKEGFLAFYRGIVPRLGRVCVDVAVTFMLYETIMDVLDQIWP